MYFDETITFENEHLPKMLKEDLLILGDFYSKNREIDFDNCEESLEVYEGRSGDRIGIVYNGENYLLKFPSNLKARELKNIDLSYSNSPLCEYIGSHIYELLGFPVHQTQLGIRNNKVVVVCKDFKDESDRFQEFGQLKVMKDYDIEDSNGKTSSSSRY